MAGLDCGDRAPELMGGELPAGVLPSGRNPVANGRSQPLNSLPPAPAAVPPEDIAVVDGTIWPGERGRVRFQATWWRAQCMDPAVVLLAQTQVRVVGREGLTLWVTPLAKAS